MALLGLTLCGLTACSAAPPGPTRSTPAATADQSSAASARPIKPKPTPRPVESNESGPKASAPSRRIERLLGQVKTTERAPYHPGYDRSCGGDGGCQFGEDWTDQHPGKFGRNGCTTREDVLLQQMREIELRWGSQCRIYEASLVDPYTGERLTWRDDGYWIQIDHIYPLAEAWHAGAWDWSKRKRLRFANDVDRELLAVSGEANQEKGSASLSEWLPANKAFRCHYVARYLGVAQAYALTITAADQATARRVAERC